MIFLLTFPKNLVINNNMSYRVEQKIGNHIYVYEATGYWDPEKKQTRQKRIYIGKKDPVTGEVIPARKPAKPKISRDFGNIWLLKELARTCGLDTHLQRTFGDEAIDILNLAAYQMCEGKPFYLFKPWLEATAIDNQNVETSQEISQFFKILGDRERERRDFIRHWAYAKPASRAVAFDITSLSSHGKLIDLLEWGYNRDGEQLPQINVGLVMRIPDGVPISYHIYPGSIADVTTIVNVVKEMKAQQISIRRFVLDRGFFSAGNLKLLAQQKIPVIIPLPFRVKLANELLSDTRKDLDSPLNGFVHQGHALFHTHRKVEIGGYSCDAHVYLDPERKARETTRLLQRLSELEAYMSQQSCETLEEAIHLLQSKSHGLIRLYRIRLDGTQPVLTRKPRILNTMINRYGKHILISKANRLDRDEVLYLYRRRDQVEKMFDTLKTELDSRRLRIHSQEALDGRLFIMFIGLILNFIMLSRIRENEYLQQYSVKEILNKLKLLRQVEMCNGESYLTEISKKQRDILKAFNVAIPER